MPAFQNFVGPSYTSRSVTVAADRTVNLYPEINEAKTGKNIAALYGCPGLELFTTIPTSPIRGLWIGEERMFVAAGSKLYEVLDDGSLAGRDGNDYLGDIGSGTDPVQIVPNGAQLLIVAGGSLYLDTGTEVKQISMNNGLGMVDVLGYPAIVTWLSGDKFTDDMVTHPIIISGVTYEVASVENPEHLTLTLAAGSLDLSNVGYEATVPMTAEQGAFLDGFFIVSHPNSKVFNVSAQLDGQNWDPLDYYTKEAYPDNISALLSDHEELWVFGTQTTEIWRTVSSADEPFQRDPGGFIHRGCIAPWTPVRLADGVAWLGGDPRGHAVAYRAQGFQPMRISTHAIESEWATYATVADAEAFVYTMDGHEWWQINFPTASKTWVYDSMTQLWHERQAGFGGRHLARNHGYVWGEHYVGAYNSGKIYRLSNSLYNDDGVGIQCIRRCPHLSDEEKRLFFSRFRVDMEPATSLQVTLSWSNNGGRTYTDPIPPSGELVSNGTPGNTIGQEWRRLGSGRDRVFELQLSAASRIAISNAFLNV